MSGKNGKKALEPKHLALAVVLTILVLTGVVLYSSRQEIEVAQPPDTLTEEKVEEEIKDGVYTNYTYGFRFEYSPETFPNVSSSKTGSFNGYSEENALSPFDLGEDGVWFSMLMRQESDPSFHFTEELFEEIFKEGDTTISEKALAENVVTTDFGSHKRVIYSFRNLPDYEGEHSFAYVGMWKRNGTPVIKIDLAAVSEGVLFTYRRAFEKIVQSFEFLD